ncbi:MAG TPA: hypothetical protein IAC12_03650 [Candidatus Aphodovivens avistercoris]|nr:hypothetical protein [Candidatus Aphodovivens avistercoris]
MEEKEGYREPTVADVVQACENLRDRIDVLEFREGHDAREIARLRRAGVPRWPFWAGLAVPIAVIAAWLLLAAVLG